MNNNYYIQNLNLENILDNIDSYLTFYCYADISNIFRHNSKLSDEFEKLYNQYKSPSSTNHHKLKDFLLAHESDIDKESLILILASNYKQLSKKLQKLNSSANKLLKSKVNLTYANDNDLKKYLNYLSKIAKKGNLNKNIAYFYNNDQNSYVEVISSQEVFENKTISDKKNLQRLQKIDSICKKNNLAGVDDILKYLHINYFPYVFSEINEKYFVKDLTGYLIQRSLLTNILLRDNKFSLDEINSLHDKDINKLFDSLTDEQQAILDSEKNKTLLQYLKYADFDKLLLWTAHNIYDELEDSKSELNTTCKNRNETLNKVKLILEIIKDNVKPSHSKVACKSQEEIDGNVNLKNIKFSIADINNILKNFIGDDYLTQEKIAKYRNKIFSDEINLMDLPSLEYLPILFSNKELEHLSLKSDKSFEVVSSYLNWNKEELIKHLATKEISSSLIKDLLSTQKLDTSDVINLYENNMLSFSQIKELYSSENLDDLAENLNVEKLYNYYQTLKLTTGKNKNKFEQQYNTYKDLFKYVSENNSEYAENFSNQLMLQLVENYDPLHRLEYLKDINNYHSNGLLQLEHLLDWDEKSISELFYSNFINTDDIESLEKNGKISYDFVSQLYFDFLNSPDSDSSRFFNCLKSGYISPDIILELYSNNLIYDDDLLAIGKLGIIDEETAKKISAERTLKVREEKAGINALTKEILDYMNFDGEPIDINKLNKYKNSSSPNHDIKPTKPTKKINYVIAPSARQQLFKSLGAVRKKTNSLPESPFFNYELYVIPDKNDKITGDSIVIAERYFKNKLTGERLAPGNATYLYTYKDFLVLCTSSKKDILDEKKDKVFPLNHTITIDDKKSKRKGHWASNVLATIFYIKAKNELPEGSPRERRKRATEMLKEVPKNISEICKLIDSGAYNIPVTSKIQSTFSKTSPTHKEFNDNDVVL